MGKTCDSCAAATEICEYLTIALAHCKRILLPPPPQIIKKWFSYREHDILRRSLDDKEAREVTQTARRSAALLLLKPRLDENYMRIKAAAYD